MQTAVTADLKSEQLLLYVFGRLRFFVTVAEYHM